MLVKQGLATGQHRHNAGNTGAHHEFPRTDEFSHKFLPLIMRASQKPSLVAPRLTREDKRRKHPKKGGSRTSTQNWPNPRPGRLIRAFAAIFVEGIDRHFDLALGLFLVSLAGDDAVVLNQDQRRLDR